MWEAGRTQAEAEATQGPVNNGTSQDLGSSCPRCPKYFWHLPSLPDPTITIGHANNAENNTCPGTPMPTRQPAFLGQLAGVG